MGGPFTSYAPPGVYTETLFDPSLVQILGAIRIPALIGVGAEELCQNGLEMVRGSSATADNRIVDEDVSDQLIGTNNVFTVTNFPVVSGNGSGTVTNDPNNILVTVNGNKANVLQLRGETGEITLQQIPLEEDEILISYYYNRTDSLIEDEDVSAQFASNVGSSSDNKFIYTSRRPVVDGTNGGIPATSPDDVVITVDDVEVEAATVDGANGLIELVSAPASTAVVLITYYTNQFANTSDDLNCRFPTRVISVGFSPDSSDFEEGTDFIIVDNTIQWGAGVKLEILLSTPGSTIFDSEQIKTTLVDDLYWNEDVSNQFTGVETTAQVRFSPITDGSGRNKTTFDPSKVTAKVNGSVVPVSRIEGDSGIVHLATTPAGGDEVLLTYWRNRLEDDTYCLEVLEAGGSGTGEYSISSAEDGRLARAEPGAERVVNASFTGVVYLTGPTATKGFAVEETVTLIFTDNERFSVVSDNPNGSGSGSTIAGRTGSSFFDDRSGLNFTIDSDPLYAAGDEVDIIVTAEGIFPVGTQFEKHIPGVNLQVFTTDGVAVGDITCLTTYDPGGREPDIGDLYYISFCCEKTDYDPTIYTEFQDIVDNFGPLTINSPITLASFLTFLNGAAAIIVKQVIATPGTLESPTINYLLALEELEKPVGPFAPNFIQPITTNGVVIAATLQHNLTQSSIRFRQERTTIYGFAVGTEYPDVITNVKNIKNRRMTAVYPDGAIIPLVDALGRENEFIVDGSYMAAAMVGVAVNPAFDVATPMTRKLVTGFRRTIRTLNETELNLTASAGVTIFQDLTPVIRIRQGRTTDPTTVFTAQPQITWIADFVQQIFRAGLDSFIGIKFLDGVLGSIEQAMTNLFVGLVQRDIIVAFTGVSAVQDETDPSIVRATAFYQPVVGLEYIVITFNLRGRL